MIRRTLSDAVAHATKAGTSLVGRRPGSASVAAAAWEAWNAGEFALAHERAADLVAAGEAVDEARHLLVLVASVTGRFDEAIALHRSIDPRYRRLGELDEPVLWDHVRGGDIAGALEFAERRGLATRGATGARLRMAHEHPLTVAGEGVAELPFVDDPLTPLMPGFDALCNGRPVVARLDTGGSFIHLSSEQAAAHGIETTASEREFAALSRHTIRYGMADLELGSIRMRHAPVAVHDDALPTTAIASHFGVELGPIVGTNLLERFLATIDTPNRRLLLSRRGDAGANHQHRALLGDGQHEVPFAVWSDHLMIARGRMGAVGDVNLFVDSGLVLYTDEQGQAALLTPRATLDRWKVPRPAPGRFAELPAALSLGGASRTSLAAHVVSDKTWRQFGDWGRIRVDALLSWGFLRQFSWTLDFDRQVFLFGESPAQRDS